MKKILGLFFVLLVCFTSIACDPGTFEITENHLKDVTKVTLITYENPDQKHFASWVPNHFDDLVSYDTSKETLLEELPDEKKDEFLTSFSQTHILHTYYVYNSPKDICIKLTYSSGNFLIVWADYKNNSFAGYIGEYTADGAVVSFWGSFSSISYYEDLVSEYFTAPLD